MLVRAVIERQDGEKKRANEFHRPPILPVRFAFTTDLHRRREHLYALNQV